MATSNRKKKELFAVNILAKTEITNHVYTIEVEKKFNFTPGQVVAISMTEKEEPRLYSIASGAEKPYIRILFDLNPQGKLTPPLSQTNVGDTIYMSEPFGKFIGNAEKAYWIATGTGIAPYISMMESGLAENKTLMHGAKELSHFYFADELKAALGNHYMRFCSQQTDENVISGRITTYLKSINTLPTNIKYYLCGNASMVVEVRDILIEKGVPYEHIIAEIYF